jgi:peptidoglycan L-alanyl-D-glutamate endopeptidase CwlK
MSAGTDLRPCHDLARLAPKMCAAVEAVLRDCEAAGLDAVVYETMRSQALQAVYFQRGASHASSVLHSWHAYGLAADIISRSKGWDVPQSWWERYGVIAKAHGLTWGGEWPTLRDYPHVQWGRCRVSPSDRARELLAEGGVEAVWAEVGAG